MGLVKKISSGVSESEISKHYTSAEMSQLDLVDAAKRKNEYERLMTESFKSKSSYSDVGAEVDGRTRYRTESILRKMNENRIKKTIDEKELKVDIGVKDRKNAYLARLNPDCSDKRTRKMSAGDIRRSTGNAHSKYRNSVKRQSSKTISGKPISPIKRRTSRPRLSAKRESWRRESETEQKSIGKTRSEDYRRSNSYTEQKNSDAKYRRKLTSPRIKASEIEKSKLKAVNELASKQSYPYGPNAAKLLEKRKSDHLLSVEENELEQNAKTEEDG